MEAHDKDIEFLKNLWANDDQREITKRVIAIALGRINHDISIETALSLGDELDDMLLEKENETRQKDKDMTM